MVNAILAKRVNHIVTKGDNPAWPKGSKSRGFSTSHFQINDARQLPIIIPQKETFESLQKLAADCISLKKVATTDDFLMGEKQYELNRLVRSLYGVEGFY